MKNQSGRKLLALSAILTLVLGLSAPAVAQDAADLYKAKCASCHAPDGSGDTAVGKKLGVKSFSDPEIAKNSDEARTDITKNGKGKMPAYAGKLTDDQIKELVKFIRGLTK
jgi:cytochrome c6